MLKCRLNRCLSSLNDLHFVRNRFAACQVERNFNRVGENVHAFEHAGARRPTLCATRYAALVAWLARSLNSATLICGKCLRRHSV